MIPDDGERAAALAAAVPLLPCTSCRAAESDAKRLVGAKLGRRERAILMVAPGPADGARERQPAPVVIEGDGQGRAAQEANRRAIRALARLGLIETGRTRVGRRARRGVRLAPLGGAVVQLLRGDLEAGRPIRWDRHLAEVASVARRDATWLRVRLAWTIESAQFYGRMTTLAPRGRGNGAGVADAQRRMAALKVVLRALSGSGESSLCGRCGEAADRQSFEPDGPALCGPCWAALGRIWRDGDGLGRPDVNSVDTLSRSKADGTARTRA